MRSELWVLALGVVLFGCKTDPGDDTGDTSDTADTADTSDTADTADTADTSDTGTQSYCGDGVVDEGEQCDLGELNGTEGDCSTECTWNGWVTCDMVSGPKVTLDTSVAQPDGTYHLNGRFEGGKVPITSSCVTGSAQNVAVELNLPADGSYLLSTANATNTSHTAISLRTDCDDRAELECGLDNSPTAGASQAWILDGLQGDAYVALIELVDGDPAGWHLSMTPIDAPADVGDDCDVSNPCVDGAVCDDDISGTCVTAAAPTITSATAVQSDYYAYRVTVTGTDADHDVVALTVPGYSDILGDIWGDEALETPIVIDDASLTWNGDQFTYTYVQSVAFYDTGLSDIYDIDYQVVDRTGAKSNAETVTWPEAVGNEQMSYIGDDCDMCVDCVSNTTGFPQYCSPNPHADPNDADTEIVGLVCTWDEASTVSTCQDRNINPAPIMDSGSMHWEGTQAWMMVAGYDNVHDQGVTAHITAVYTDESTVDLGSQYLPGTSWDHGDFTAANAFSTDAIDGAVDYLEVYIEDRGTPLSATTETPLVIDWVDYVEPVEVGYNAECDLNGWDSVCEDPYVCSPTLSGVPACRDSEAPILYGASGVYQGGFFATFTVDFEAWDTNADWYALMAESTTGAANANVFDGFDAPWDPSPHAQQLYSGTSVFGFANWMYRVWLQDADGNVSDPTVVMGVPAQGLGEECATGVCSFFGCSPPETYCDVNAGLTCGSAEKDGIVTQTCQTNEAPVLDSVTVRRIDSDTFTVDFVGSDANWDANDIHLIQDEGGVITLPHVSLDWQTPIYGAQDFTGRFNGTISDPFAEVTLTIAVQDYAFATSDTITVTVPPILEVDQECSGDDTVDKCWEGADCIDGTCFAYAPQLSSAELEWTDNGRDAKVIVKGFDDKVGTETQLKQLYVTLAGKTYSKSLSSYSVSWNVDGNNPNEFTVSLDAKGVGTGALIGEQFVHVEIADLGGFSDSASYFVTPHKGFGDECDEAGVADTCHAGLTCDAGVCVTDVADPCAGIPMIVADSDEFIVNTSTGTNWEAYPDYATCGSASNNPTGKETAVEYVATQDGTLVISAIDDPSDGNVLPGFLFVRFGECVNYDAVAECSNLRETGVPNEVMIDVLAGDVLYIMVDSPSYPSGGPVQLTLGYL